MKTWLNYRKQNFPLSFFAHKYEVRELLDGTVLQYLNLEISVISYSIEMCSIAANKV